MPDNNTFFLYYDSISPRLISKAIVCGESKNIIVKAKWDTGATHTCISQSIVDALDLVPSGDAAVATSNLASKAKTYIVDIVLPNNYRCEGIRVIGNQNESPVHDILIGMDIISLGDFAVSNFNGRTSFTFRIPSQEEINFNK